MSRSILICSLLATTALTAPAQAEITPAEVWQDLRSYMQSFGYAVTGTETGGGDELVVQDVVMTATLPEGEGTVTIELGTLTLADTGDAVSMQFEEVMPIRFDVLDPEDGRIQGVVEYRQTGLDMQVSGSANASEYDYMAENLTLELTELTIDGQEAGRDIVRFAMAFSDVAGNSLNEVGGERMLTQSFSAGEIGYNLFLSDPEGDEGEAQVVGAILNAELTGETEMPLTASNTSNPFADVTAAVDITHGGGQLNVNATEQGNITVYSSTSQSGGFAIDLTETGVGYEIVSSGVTAQFVSPDTPFPVALEAEETAFALGGPVRPTDEAEEFNLLLALRGFEMTDMIWNMFDPSGALPRDPATFEIDLTGTARQLFDLFDESQAEAIEESDMPAEIETLNIDALTLEIAGALLTGTGAFTFDNSDLTTFDGIPRPEGELNLELAGANQLIDTLISIGLLPEDQAMGARMMLSMFARPAGDDLLTSTIEINEAGHVLANGQRLQ